MPDDSRGGSGVTLNSHMSLTVRSATVEAMVLGAAVVSCVGDVFVGPAQCRILRGVCPWRTRRHHDLPREALGRRRQGSRVPSGCFARSLLSSCFLRVCSSGNPVCFRLMGSTAVSGYRTYRGPILCRYFFQFVFRLLVWSALCWFPHGFRALDGDPCSLLLMEK